MEDAASQLSAEVDQTQVTACGCGHLWCAVHCIVEHVLENPDLGSRFCHAKVMLTELVQHASELKDPRPILEVVSATTPQELADRVSETLVKLRSEIQSAVVVLTTQ